VGDHIVLVMEYVSAGSLDALLCNFGQLSAATTVNYLRDILHGLHRLHQDNIMHRDVKPQNVLVTSLGVCKLTDFGASAIINAMVRGEGTVEGTPLYLSPEAAQGKATFKSDVWAVGIMFLQLISGRPPYDIPADMSPDVFVFQVGSGRFRPTWKHDTLPPAAEEFVRCCLEPDVSLRKSALELLSLSFFQTRHSSTVTAS
jgi:serine/threonine protein kinase